MPKYGQLLRYIAVRHDVMRFKTGFYSASDDPF